MQAYFWEILARFLLLHCFKQSMDFGGVFVEMVSKVTNIKQIWEGQYPQ
jgi:hypothetical protein